MIITKHIGTVCVIITEKQLIMNYKKLIGKRMSGLHGHSGDKTAAVVGLLAGLAVGAVLGVLFAPDSGRRTRERITDKALDLADNVKDGLHSVKDTLSNGRESLKNLKDEVVDKVKHKARAVSEEYKEFREEELKKAERTEEDPGYAGA